MMLCCFVLFVNENEITSSRRFFLLRIFYFDFSIFRRLLKQLLDYRLPLTEREREKKKENCRKINRNENKITLYFDELRKKISNVNFKKFRFFRIGEEKLLYNNDNKEEKSINRTQIQYISTSTTTFRASEMMKKKGE